MSFNEYLEKSQNKNYVVIVIFNDQSTERYKQIRPVFKDNMLLGYFAVNKTDGNEVFLQKENIKKIKVTQQK